MSETPHRRGQDHDGLLFTDVVRLHRPEPFTAEDMEAVHAGVLALDEDACYLLATELRRVLAKIEAHIRA